MLVRNRRSQFEVVLMLLATMRVSKKVESGGGVGLVPM